MTADVAEELCVKLKVLFVDDEPQILQGLKRTLHPMRSQWEIAFANSGKEALEQFANTSFDVIVSDIRMPEMDGTELLKIVKEKYPQTIRLALSGEMGKEFGYKVARIVNQCLSKPASADQIKAAINRASGMKKALQNDDIKERVSQMEHLPSLPDMYNKIKQIIESPSASMSDVADVISKDMAMTAKILQLANSAFFGIARKITSIKHAVTMLGLELIADLVLTVHLFHSYENNKALKGFSVEQLWSHALTVAGLATQLAKEERCPQEVIDESFLTGMLHQLGKLVLAVNFPDEFSEVLQIMKAEKKLDWVAERDVFSTSYPEVGAYLGGVWGFPAPVIEGMAFHLQPQMAQAGEEKVPVTFVHIAAGIIYKKKHGKDRLLDQDYLRKLNLMNKVLDWEKLV
ncbi:Uncharacterized protein SCG7109_AA_00520 [Chlamydiales bacterium SCGC AG-110-M15]|nr:Uncharacterized protein SCG7109_AA_00520 [Chlamydiales bacterium SCGC AG-110-M15]